MASEEKLKNDLSEVLLHTGGDFLIVKMSLAKELKGDGDGCLVYGYMANILRMKQKRELKRLLKSRLWFRCPAKDIQEDLGMTKPKQIRIVKRLVERGLIKAKSRGIPRSLWVKLLTQSNVLLRNETRPTVGYKTSPTVVTKRDYYIDNNLYKKGNNCPPLADGGIVFSEWAIAEARKLLAGLNKKKKIRRRPNIRCWAAELDQLAVEVRRLKEVEHFKAQKFIQKLIAVHLENLDGRYWPKAYSATAFREKFIAIMEAEARIKEPEVEWGAYGNDGTLRFKRRNKPTDAEMEDFSWYPLIGGVKVNGEQRRQLLEAK